MIEAYSRYSMKSGHLLVEANICRFPHKEPRYYLRSEKDESVLEAILRNGLISLGFLGGANFGSLEQSRCWGTAISSFCMTEYDEVNMVSAVLAKMGINIVRVRNRNIPIPTSRKICWASPGCQSGIADSSLCANSISQMPSGSILATVLPWWNLRSNQIAISAI